MREVTEKKVKDIIQLLRNFFSGVMKSKLYSGHKNEKRDGVAKSKMSKKEERRKRSGTVKKSKQRRSAHLSF